MFQQLRSVASVAVITALIGLTGGCPPASPDGRGADSSGGATDNGAVGDTSGASTTSSTALGSAAGPNAAGGVAPSDAFDLAALAVFPTDNPWNQDISGLPLHPNSAAYISSIGAGVGLHPDFGTVYEGAPIGIPCNVVSAGTPRVSVVFDYADESDPGPYPIPLNPLIEGGPNSDGDRHILMIDPAARRLHELFYAYQQPDGSWTAGSGAIFDLTSSALRPAGWTSADAAGLPIFPGLVRYDEVVQRGEIRHALRFTISRSQRA